MDCPTVGRACPGVVVFAPHSAKRPKRELDANESERSRVSGRLSLQDSFLGAETIWSAQTVADVSA
jgi:hypothetical protein